VKLKAFRIKGKFFVTLLGTGTTGVITPQWLRWVLVHDKSPNGVQPVYNIIFGHQGDSGAGGYAAGTVLTDAINPVYMQRFKILKEGTINMNPYAGVQGSGVSIGQYYDLDEYVKARGIETVYNASSTPNAAIGDISTGAVYLILRCSNADNVVKTEEFAVRTTYYDM